MPGVSAFVACMVSTRSRFPSGNVRRLLDVCAAVETAVSSRARLSALLLLAPSASSSSSFSSSSPALDAGGHGAGISSLPLMTTTSRFDGDSVCFFCDGDFTRVLACCFSRLGAVARAPSSESWTFLEMKKKEKETR
jgi:hypothetical protein